MYPASRFLSLHAIYCLLARAALLLLCCEVPAFAQGYATMYAGPDSNFEQIDFAQMNFDQSNKRAKLREEQQARNKELVDSGAVSALDLEAPNNAIDEFNRASVLLKAQNSKEAMKHLQKAIADYSKFVSAHIGLGLAYVDQEDTAHAKSEFEAAAILDRKFPGSFLHLGELALSQKDFASAELELEKAAALSSKNVKILSTLAYAQSGAHEYVKALETAQRVHDLPHVGMANVHYVAAAAAMALNNFDMMARELTIFLNEDPTNAFAPAARRNLAILAHNKEVGLLAANDGGPQQLTKVSAAPPAMQTFPNSDRLKAQLSALGNEPDGDACDSCEVAVGAKANILTSNGRTATDLPPGSSNVRGVWIIRKSVDDVAVFFSVSSHGRMVNDLEQSDVGILDDNKPPKSVVQFSSQSKLPLRLALLVDTSGSVRDRFSFEKKAATKFIEKVLNGTTDLGFVSGFAAEPTITQDFSSAPSELGAGIEKLANGGGTALFDAVSYACRKLANYPDDERVARVLVIVSDGEDNSSHGTLKQTIQTVEKTGVTVYTISTKEELGSKTDADRVLEALAERSGGEAMFPVDSLSLGRSFDKLRDLIRSRYFIAYKPADFQPNGEYRSISIRAAKDGKRLQVRARKGYHARLEASPN